MPYSIARLIATLLGVAVMIGFYFLIHWLVTGISSQFGDGFFVGMMLMLLLVYGAWRVSPESFTDRRER